MDTSTLTQLWLGVLLMDTSTLQVKQEIEPPTFWLVDNLYEPLSHCRQPSNWSGFEQEEVRFFFFFICLAFHRIHDTMYLNKMRIKI